MYAFINDILSVTKTLGIRRESCMQHYVFVCSETHKKTDSRKDVLTDGTV